MKQQSSKNFAVLAGLLFAFAFGFQSCAKKQVVKPVTPASEETAKPGDLDAVQSKELDIHGKEFTPDTQISPIYFAYDTFTLPDDSTQALLANAQYIRAKARTEFLVEGHCDERGTTAYNLVLGQKRANVVREYYVNLGIPVERIGMISYGEEHPVCSDKTESCWGKNRRGETKIRPMDVQK